ncbi:hypothetical protein HDC92_001653 [Pedobacter sp. AK017]|uniref:hypothetical protein n=1 Tax=Pedobacter sp. AK017 TaxID=2723073 RepID=UPI001610ED43|nr:hypothetical protein [Pedobacter sp. AK017]MBB5437979.1 hypothetical protein [Pedobacter sp. AK017]
MVKRGGNQVGAPIDAVADASGNFSKSAPLSFSNSLIREWPTNYQPCTAPKMQRKEEESKF